MWMNDTWLEGDQKLFKADEEIKNNSLNLRSKSIWTIYPVNFKTKRSHKHEWCPKYSLDVIVHYMASRKI